MNDNHKTIIELASLAQKLIIDLHVQDAQNDTFEQLGILDGYATVADFIRYGEAGCAVSHLLYMVY